MELALPLLRQAETPATLGVEAKHRAGDRIEPRREDEHVDRVLARRGAHTGLRHRFDRVLAQVDQRDVVAVVRGVVAIIEDRALGAVEVVRHQLLGRRRVVDDLADLAAQERTHFAVDLFVDKELGVVAVDEAQGALCPELFVERLTLFRSLVEGRAPIARHHREHRVRRRGGDHSASDFFPVLSDGLELLLSEGAVACGDRELRRALEHGDVFGLLGDLRDRLDARRAGADHADALTRERDRFVRPVTRVQAFAFEIVDPRNVGLVRR